MNTRSLSRRSNLGVAALGAAALLGVILAVGCTEKSNPSAPPSTYTLTLTSDPAGSGSFSQVPEGTTFNAGTTVTVTVSPKTPKYKFLGWDGASTSKDSVITITMDGAKTLTAKFEERFMLTTVVSPESSGTINRSVTSDYYSAGSKVVLTAIADTGCTFLGWVVKDSIIQTDFQLSCTVNSDTTITAKFQKKYRILVTKEGAGDVELDPAGPFYEVGTVVTLTATPDDDATFMSWRKPDGTLYGDVNTGTNPVLKITIGEADVKLTAKFSD